VRFCVIYDCLYPYTVGGAERWYRTLALELAAEGHDVTYLTRRQWEQGDEPALEGVEVVAVSAGGPLYDAAGRRTITSPLRFALGVFGHLLRNRGRYDVIHSGSFPYFQLFALALAAPRTTRGVDWFEVWTLDYWRGYLGSAGGRIGYLVQRLCVRLTPRAFVFSGLQGRRLRDEGHRGELITLEGLYDGPVDRDADVEAAREPLVVCAARQIPEKRIAVVPGAIAQVRARVPQARALIFGDGPEHERVLEQIRAHDAASYVDARGFVDSDEIAAALRAASCHVLPSLREGYGMVVVEAAAVGTPSVVVREPDNAASELVIDGVNGYVANSLAELPDAITRVLEEGSALRAAPARWFTDKVDRVSAAQSAKQVAAAYAGAAPGRT
jgi:glycosyltransferase involved in cell wall biosynthesis